MRCRRRGAATPQMPARRRARQAVAAGLVARSLDATRMLVACSSQRAWGPAAKCEFISAQALRPQYSKK